MGEKQRLEKAQVKTLKVGVSQVIPNDGGTATVTGTLAVTTNLKTIAGVVASLGATPSANAAYVTTTVSGGVVTLKVWKSDFTASTTATAVNWTAVGS